LITARVFQGHLPIAVSASKVKISRPTDNTMSGFSLLRNSHNCMTSLLLMQEHRPAWHQQMSAHTAQWEKFLPY
jgi:hypothetical protein